MARKVKAIIRTRRSKAQVRDAMAIANAIGEAVTSLLEMMAPEDLKAQMAIDVGLRLSLCGIQCVAESLDKKTAQELLTDALLGWSKYVAKFGIQVNFQITTKEA